MYIYIYIYRNSNALFPLNFNYCFNYFLTYLCVINLLVEKNCHKNFFFQGRCTYWRTCYLWPANAFRPRLSRLEGVWTVDTRVITVHLMMSLDLSNTPSVIRWMLFPYTPFLYNVDDYIIQPLYFNPVCRVR